jgi:hypothetical protein
MNGAEALVRTLLGAGVDLCFANPGTSEMHFVAAKPVTPQGRLGACGRRGPYYVQDAPRPLETAPWPRAKD